jgi:multiple sugar transport system substrate-binding protein
MDKKKLLMILGALVIILLGLLAVVLLRPKEPSGGNGQDPPSQNQQVILEYWGLWESQAVMQPLIDEYESENPNVKIIYTQKEAFSQYETTLFTRLQQSMEGGSPAPDIFRINNTWLNLFQPYLSTVPATVMTPAEYADTFYPTAVNDFTGTDMNLYAIPLEIDGLALFYNKEMLSEIGLSSPPTDWDSLIEASIALTRTDADGRITRAGVGMGGSTNVMHSADILSLLFLQNGVTINRNYNKEVDLSSQKAIDAMTFYVSFAKDHRVWNNDLRTDLEMFYRGELAMMFGPSWRAFDIINSNPTIEFGIAPTPTLVGDEVYYSMYWAEAVARSSPNSVEAWKFIKYLTEQQQQRDFFNNSMTIGGRAFGEPYARKDMSSELINNVYAGSIIKMAPNMKAWKMGEQTYIETQLRTAIHDVVVNEKEPQNALKQAQDAINAKLETSIQ